LLYELGNKQWNITKLKALLEDILPKCSELNDFEVTHDFPSIGSKTMRLNARQIFREAMSTRTVLLAFEDITSKK
jgi:phage FluMu protein Com